MDQETLPFVDIKNEAPPRRAAMYVRMSTDHQKYSTENQAQAIREYAAKYRIDIIKTYADEGKSGLKIAGREALQRLIDEVQAGAVPFSMILVLDVTRWGRFQDADESAYYEYICRRAGLDVQYVAEPFENDGSTSAVLVKSVKRIMAGEYSRELSKKVFAGQCRLIELGFRQGGPAGYGLQRMRVDEHGQPKKDGVLQRGECKSMQTERVVLIPGPKEEVEIVQGMYRAFTEEGLSESQIAASLNQRGVLTDLKRPWTRGTVHEVLTNEKYIGNNVFNRTSFKLKEKRVVNTPSMWVRAENAFEPVVEPRYFYTAQGIIRARSLRLSDDEMLGKLKTLQERQGWLSGMVIDEMDGMPSSSAYQHRFGSLVRAYQLIGYTPDRDYRYIEVNRHLRKTYASIVEDAIRHIKALGAEVRREVTHDMLIINDTLKVSVVICRCQETEAGNYRWNIRFDSGLRPDITIAIRMNAANEAPLDYYLLPAIDIENPKIRLSQQNGLALDAYRFDNLEPFFLLTEEVSVLEVA